MILTTSMSLIQIGVPELIPLAMSAIIEQFEGIMSKLAEKEEHEVKIRSAAI